MEWMDGWSGATRDALMPGLKANEALKLMPGLKANEALKLMR